MAIFSNRVRENERERGVRRRGKGARWLRGSRINVKRGYLAPSPEPRAPIRERTRVGEWGGGGVTVIL